MISGHVFIATSLDGFIARTDGDIDWLATRSDQTEDHGYNEFIEGMDGIVMGRGTYEKVLSFEAWPYTKPVVVLSQSLLQSSLPENLKGKVRFINLLPKDTMSLLASEGWKKVYVDGGQVVQSFIRDNLIEEMVITVVPVLIGSGRTLFGSLRGDVSLSLLKTKSFSSGLVQLTYRII